MFSSMFRSQRASVPTVLQMEATECGAACLAMVLAHYGLWVPIDKLRVSCGVSRNGSNARNIVRAARTYGMTAGGRYGTLEGLSDLRLPAILFWEFNHFVVLEGFSRHKVYLNDPASGPRVVDRDTFSRSFTGVVLALEPGPDFRPSGKRPHIWRSIASRLASSREAATFLVLAGIAALVPGIVVPAATKIFVDDILVRHLTDWLRPLLFGLVVAAILRGLLSWLQGYYLARLQRKLGAAMGLQLMWHLLRLPPDFFAHRYTGDIAARLQAAERTCQLIGGQMPAAAIAMVAALFYAMIMVLYDPYLASIGVGLAAFNWVFVRLFAQWQEDSVRGLLKEQAKLGSVAINGIQGIETVKATASENELFLRISGVQARLMNATLKMQVPSQLLNLIPSALGVITTAAILGIGGLRAMEGALTLGTLAAFQTMLASFLGQVSVLTGVATSLRELRGNLERVEDVLGTPLDKRYLRTAQPESSTARPHALPGTKLSGAVEIRDLVYGFSPLDPPLIEGLSLSIEPGASVALVGRSGSGKSTIARLIVGLTEPWSGIIQFDGRDSASIPNALRAASLAFVDQDIVLFEGTVRQNLAVWDPAVTEQRIISAARDAEIHDAIASRPGAYDTAVAEGATNWSGGQAQRLELARALAQEPSLLILDEATSALDAATEAHVIENIRRRGCTTVLVTHRVSAIKDADLILVIDGGKIVQQGSYTELLNSPGPFRELIHGE
jgi:NHLM bacteriocin system ABC transporter peptidase/ATP-binding protein